MKISQAPNEYCSRDLTNHLRTVALGSRLRRTGSVWESQGAEDQNASARLHEAQSHTGDGEDIYRPGSAPGRIIGVRRHRLTPVSGS